MLCLNLDRQASRKHHGWIDLRDEGTVREQHALKPPPSQGGLGKPRVLNLTRQPGCLLRNLTMEGPVFSS